MFDYKSTDIDWFCFINGCPIHVASNGGELPRNLCTQQSLINAFDTIQATEPLCDWEINRKFVTTRNEKYNYIDEIEESNRDSFLLPDENLTNLKDYKGLSPREIAYSWSFIEMARRGFFSFDRVEGNNYSLVAYPSDFRKIKTFEFPNDLIYKRFYPFFYHHNKKILSMTRHLFTEYENFSFSLDEPIDLIDTINSIISD